MPEQETLERAHEDEREGKSPSTQAGEFVREEMHHVREGKHGARSPQQACSGLPSLVIPRNTRMRPDSPSATKMSPFGAVRNVRGLSSPAAYNSTLNPGSATGHAFSGRVTKDGPLFADSVANGCGRSLTVILRTVPGFS